MQGKLIINRAGAPQTRETPRQTGAKGNQETLAIMAQIVREDSRRADLKRFVTRYLLPGIEQKTDAGKIQQIYEFCRDEILYLDDSPGVERVADLWTCLFGLGEFSARGDCVIKSVCLATLLAMFGGRPCFIAIRSTSENEALNHVFCGLPAGNRLLSLDALPATFQIGDEAPSVSKVLYRIF